MEWKHKRVVVTGADRPAGRVLVQLLEMDGAQVCALGSDPATLQEQLAQCGPIDALLCDCGVEEPGLTATTLTAEVLREGMTCGPRFGWKSALYALPGLTAAPHSSVVFLSGDSIRHQTDRNILSAICATAVESMTRNLASEVASRRVRVCSVLYGSATAQEAAAAALFLAGDGASYMTGTTLTVGGCQEG